MNDSVSDGRAHFGFAEAALAEFEFLTGKGFVPYEVTSTIVRYRRGPLLVNVYHGRRSYEIGFEIGREDDMWRMGSIIRLVDPPLAKSYRLNIAFTPEVLRLGLRKLAAAVRQYADAALNDAPEFFDALREQSARAGREFAMDQRERQVRPKANAAFKAGKYAEAVALFEQMDERLTPVERQKLAVARRRSSVSR